MSGLGMKILVTLLVVNTTRDKLSHLERDATPSISNCCHRDWWRNCDGINLASCHPLSYSRLLKWHAGRVADLYKDHKLGFIELFIEKISKKLSCSTPIRFVSLEAFELPVLFGPFQPHCSSVRWHVTKIVLTSTVMTNHSTDCVESNMKRLQLEIVMSLSAQSAQVAG